MAESDEIQGEGGEEEFLEARIDNLSITNVGFIVFLRCGEQTRVLPIFIGANEAQSIALALNRQPPPRPMTHDLLKNMLEFLDCTITRVEVYDIKENTFFGRIYMNRAGIEDVEFDSRPSDAIALAIRWQAPIYVSRRVFEEAAVDATQQESGALPEDATQPPETSVKAAEALPPVQRLKDALQKALRDEHYEEAARIRDELKKLHSGN